MSRPKTLDDLFNQLKKGETEELLLILKGDGAGSVEALEEALLGIEVGDDVIAGGASKIFTRVPAGRVILGNPAVKMETQMEIQKAMRRLPRFAQQLAKLQETVTRLLEKG